MDPKTRNMIAKTLRAAAVAVIQAGSGRVVEQRSPLTYKHSAPVLRLALIDPSAPAHPPKESYFAETQKLVKRGPSGRALKVPKTETVPGAGEGVVAFLDFHMTPGPDGKKAVYIDYMSTRGDQQGAGHMRTLVDHLYKAFDDAIWIDWGMIMNDHVERLWRKYRDRESGPRTYGKL